MILLLAQFQSSFAFNHVETTLSNLQNNVMTETAKMETDVVRNAKFRMYAETERSKKMSLVMTAMKKILMDAL